ncbi:MAG: FG-GAP repeat domain-containing protein [Anaerolineae bacterium]
MAWGDVDGDGDLDLAAGNYEGGADVYLNTGGQLAHDASWSSNDHDDTRSVAWGDVDGDGNLDLAAGNAHDVDGHGGANKVYFNTWGQLATDAAWSHNDAGLTNSVAWGDVDGDGDLDLAVGNDGPNKVYLNTEGQLATDAAWSSNDAAQTASVAWGDVDGDGDLDLAAGNVGGANKLYLNTGRREGLSPVAAWSSNDADSTGSVAWGDVDGDGDLDLAAGSSGAKVYLNTGGQLATDAAWSSNDDDSIYSVAWGDVDGDGDLDLAAGNYEGGADVYFNTRGQLAPDAAWSSNDDNITRSVAWGDVDGDGDLDLAAGNNDCHHPFNHVVCGGNKVYLNTGGQLATDAAWSSNDPDSTDSVAWGDVDGDGDLDLAAGNGCYATFDFESVVCEANKVYLNTGGQMAPDAAWSSNDADYTWSVAWGDVDGDGDLDLAAGNGCYATFNHVVCGGNKVYLNTGGQLAPDAAWSSNDADDTHSVAWGDVDGDGDLDLAAGNVGGANKVYLNTGGQLAPDAAWSSTDADDTYSVAWGDVDGDGDLDLAAGNDGSSNNIYTNTTSQTAQPPHCGKPLAIAFDRVAHGQVRNANQITLRYRLSHPEGDTFRHLAASYSIDGGGHWITATATADTITNTVSSNLASVFTWDVFASGFFGRSDNVVLRFVAYPNLGPRKQGVPGPFQRPFVSTQTMPFRVQGTQVRVLRDGQPVPGARVYDLPEGRTTGATQFTNLAGQPFLTDAAGYLQGRGQLKIKDRLVALAPITHTVAYTVFLTSATPDESGLAASEVEKPGIQTLTVTPENAFILFNLDLSLEWDARNDRAYLDQLSANLQRTSEALYDWTNGQAALGDLTVYSNREHWNDADIRVYASNRVRPSAVQGGIVEQLATVIDPANSGIVYRSGQVHMGATWNRFGDGSGNLAEDWPRTLAHELGHYLFFLDDLYLGFDQDGFLSETDRCPDSAMGDPYRFSEFHHGDNWQHDCGDTLAQYTTKRWDWKTIETFYKPGGAASSLPPWISGARRNAGPATLPLAVTRVTLKDPVPIDSPKIAFPLAAPYFNVTLDGHASSPGARAFAFRGDPYGTDLGHQFITDLGRPSLGRILARGVRPGDRLCVFDISRDRFATTNDTTKTGPALGCRNIAENDNLELDLRIAPNWRPEVALSAEVGNVDDLSDDRLNLVVAGDELPDGVLLRARLYPHDGPATKAILLIGSRRTGYSGNFSLAQFPPGTTVLPPEGMVHVWVEEPEPKQAGDSPRREIVADYAIGGNPGRMWGSGGRMWGSGGRMWGTGAPVMSPDGKVVLYSKDLVYAPGEFFGVQPVSALPTTPDWVTTVGEAYRVFATKDLLSQAKTPVSIAFNYLGADVPPGEEREGWLRVARYDETGKLWSFLPTHLDANHNVASAHADRNGIYALFSSIEVTVKGPGWVPLSFPVPVTKPRPVDQALSSIRGSYDTVYGYEQSDVADPWKVYAPQVPTWVNDLVGLSFGRFYWINLTTALPLTIRYRGTGIFAEHGSPAAGRPIRPAVADQASIGLPPATYYGAVLESPGFTPRPEMLVKAMIGDAECGRGSTFQQDNQIVYTLNALAESSLEPKSTGCGLAGADRVVSFIVNNTTMAQTPVWRNDRVWPLTLSADVVRPDGVYLPLAVVGRGRR